MQKYERLLAPYLDRQKNITAVVIGDLPMDRIILIDGKEIIRPGGPGYYTALALKDFPVNLKLISCVGEDFQKEMLPELVRDQLYPQKAKFEKSLVYLNDYSSGLRIQKAIFGDCLDFPDYDFITQNQLGYLLKNPDILFIAPLRPINPQIVGKLCAFVPEDCLNVGIIQGWFRSIQEDGLVIKRDIREIEPDMEEISAFLDIMVMSDDDIDDAFYWSKKWSEDKDEEKGPIVVVTQNIKGATLFQNGEGAHSDAYQIGNVVDPTGAGDRFSAFFAFMYKITDDPIYSSKFANAATALSLQNSYKELKLGDILGKLSII